MVTSITGELFYMVTPITYHQVKRFIGLILLLNSKQQQQQQKATGLAQ